MPELLNQLLRKEAFESGDVKLELWNKFVINYEKSFVNRCELMGIEMFDKFQEEEAYRQSCLRTSKLNISRNEIADIFQGVVPKYVAMNIASYHRHPIDEFIGVDKLIERFERLSIIPIIIPCANQPAMILNKPSKKFSEMFYLDYDREREWNVNLMSIIWLSAHYRIRKVFYPIDTRHLKEDIMRIALRFEVKLKKSWTKSKMIEEFYKRSN
jgi:hypothetical protein|tara:strand:+ start:1789 stop:2427 length:639 start_codon:yes stop_codon:yes gene_type:complete